MMERTNEIYINWILGKGLECYKCYTANDHGEECMDDYQGETVTCQMEDEHAENYGNVCEVGHTRK